MERETSDFNKAQTRSSCSCSHDEHEHAREHQVQSEHGCTHEHGQAAKNEHARNESAPSRSSGDLNSTPNANRIHIGFFGRRNAGKSTVVNALAGQEVSIVSSVKGTTTDPVTKAMEILPIGPVLLIDTPGIDDTGGLGEMRVARTNKMMARTDIAVLVIDNFVGLSDQDKELIKTFRKREIPFLVAFNKIDLGIEALNSGEVVSEDYGFPFVKLNAREGEGIDDLKNMLVELSKDLVHEINIINDVIPENSVVILVTPIDSSAPKGRLILPQVQTIRDILDGHCISMICQPEELPNCIDALENYPFAVVTDSQAFDEVNDMVPDEVYLTSFSILFARFKGILDTALRGAISAETLKDGDKVLISEGCTHHRQCEDIGTVKLPKWLEEFSGAKLDFSFTQGGDYPSDLSEYDLIVHCGGCMLNEKEMRYRMNLAEEQDIPFTNYGTLIAHMNGILMRSVEIFHQ